MRIDSGLSGYYYDQSKYRYLNAEKDDASAAASQAQALRSSAPQVESSTLLSANLSDALWAIEGSNGVNDRAARSSALLNPSLPVDTPEKAEARYMEFSLGSF